MNKLEKSLGGLEVESLITQNYIDGVGFSCAVLHC